MRIAFIVDRFPNISETFILNQITGLMDRGHHIDIYADWVRDPNETHPDVINYGLLGQARYVSRYRSGRIFQKILLLSQSLFKSPAILSQSAFFFKKSLFFESLRIFYSAAPFLQKKESYDIIHCHFGQNGLKGALLRRTGAISGKLITTFHGFDITAYIGQHGHLTYEPLFSTGDLFLPISEKWRKKLVELGCNENKILVHRMGVDSSKFAFSPRKRNPNDPVTLVTIGRLVEKKGIEYGIRAMAEILKNHKKLKYIIIGGGPLQTALQDLVESLKIEDSVKLIGKKRQQEVIKILNKSHILVAPSVTGRDGDQEGTPVSLMEAMATGIPVVSTQHSGINELVENGATGFLVPERDKNSLADRISYLISHPDVCLQMGIAARAHIERYFNIHRLNNRLAEIYEELLRPV
jgi:colanic acid/amylovoran/stewartan biosynthesis glycosyltransferase WcaL/AmsK/CpsK